MVSRGLVVFVFFLTAQGAAQQVPHNQDRPPGPALSPEEARAKMTVPDGFRVEVFASEPDIINPVTMHFDERGRIWVAESLEYPRRDPGPGQDRIKILEDTDGDGKADKFTIFADGLNIPAGVLVGNGGVYITNSPDIIFLRDTNGDDKADEREVILTGFGRFDTHELPNTLTWGPDGWIYGLNGVFNPAVVSNKGKEFHFDAALWRFHPRTHDFELFAEGTSNPWGMAWDSEGNAFVSACVIDHLYHLAETGYYHRQGGPYPPFTWKIESVVNHQHQKAAYCSLAYYDADVYPEKYRGRLYMGNIHGSCINADRLERRGATYETSGEPDFLSANDAWFMPTAIRLGPDGCFYVLDWYDRYHCYQDANRDPKGIDRLKGRVYRIAFGKSPRAGKIDLAKEPAEKLREQLGDVNLWWRDEAKRALAERIASGKDSGAAAALKQTVLDEDAPKKTRVHALWTLASAENPGEEPKVFDAAFHLKALALKDDTLRAWAVRAAGNSRLVKADVKARVRELCRDPNADVRLQVAAAARKLFPDTEAITLLLDTLAASQGDPLIPKIVWRNVEPLLETAGAQFASYSTSKGIDSPAFEPLLGRIAERLMARKDHDLGAVTALAGPLLAKRATSRKPAEAVLGAIARALTNGEVAEPGIARLKEALAKPVGEVLSGPKSDSLYFPALITAASWKEPQALREASSLLTDPQSRPEARSKALEAALASRDASAIESAMTVLKSQGQASEEFLREVLAGLGRLDSPAVATSVLDAMATLPPTVKSQAIDLLTQRPAWALALISAVDSKRVDRTTMTLNQVRRMLALKNEALTKKVGEVWGQVRSERNPEREKVMGRMKKVLETGTSNAWNGKVVFEKTCAKCHTIFGKGAAVGPDITVNGRETLDALLTNLLDPNLVIGTGYQAYTLATTTGRVLSGLLLEDSPQRVVLKIEGGKEEVVPRGEVQTLEQSQVSLMPEDLEKTVNEQEFRDLINYLRYDEAPPEPVETQKATGDASLRAEQTFGLVTVKAGAKELLRLEHSNDQRPFIHPLREAASGAILTALRPDDHAWQYGVFTGHARVNGVDFWHEKGWIRSRGLESVKESGDTVEIVAVSDWLNQRRGGKRILAERQRVVVHAPDAKAGGAYALDFDWELTPDEDVTIGQFEYGGLSVRPANHLDRRIARGDGAGADGSGWPWQDMSGAFQHDGKKVEAGVAIFDHPKNPGYPSVWRVDGQGLINPAITARGPLSVPKGQTMTFRYRLVVHPGHGDKTALDKLYREWAEGAK